MRIYTDISVLAGCDDAILGKYSQRLIDRFIHDDAIMVVSLLMMSELGSAPESTQRMKKQIPKNNIEIFQDYHEANELADNYIREQSGGTLQNGHIEIIDDSEQVEILDDSENILNQKPIVRLVNILIAKAISDGAGKILIEPFPNSIRIRLETIDAVHEIPAPPRSTFDPILSRLKIMANLDILETRKPQEGRFKVELSNRRHSVKITTNPTENGETILIHFPEHPKIDFKKFVETAMRDQTRANALQFACATVARANAFATLNPLQIKSQNIYHSVSFKMKYPLVEICTPKELLSKL